MVLTVNMLINLDQLSQNENEPHSLFAQVSYRLNQFLQRFFCLFRKMVENV